MYPYPQQSTQNPASRKPWWLIFGLSFGIGFGLFDLIYYYLLEVLPFPVGSILAGWPSEILFFLLYFSVCLIVGTLAAGKTYRAVSGTLASLLVGLFFILFEFISLAIVRNLPYFPTDLLSVFPAVLLGIYVSFIGGLIGRTTDGTRKIIGFFFAVGVILESTALINLILNAPYNGMQSSIAAISIAAIGSIGGIIAWIMTLVQFAQAQAWGRFALAIFFSGIMVLVYLIVGAQPSQPVQYVALQLGAYPPVAPQPGVYPSPMPVQQPDAISILQQRFARGEIDAETYKQMVATLTQPPMN